jgi:polyadenylate-binding protein
MPQPVMQMPVSAQAGSNSQPRMGGPGTVVGVPSTLPQAAQVQFTMNARNIQQPPQQQPALPINSLPSSAGGNRVTSGQPGPGEGKLSAAEGISLDVISGENFVATVQNADSTEQKQLLGEKLYAMIKNWHPEWAGKLTGMLLEIENRELLAMIMDHREDVPASNLRKKVDSALQVLVANKSQT